MIRDVPDSTGVRVCGVPIRVGAASDTHALVKDRPELIKDQATGAVLNTDQQGLAAYRARRQQIRDQQVLATRVADLERKIDLILAALTSNDRRE